MWNFSITEGSDGDTAAAANLGAARGRIDFEVGIGKYGAGAIVLMTV